MKIMLSYDYLKMNWFSISDNGWPCQQYFKSNKNIMKIETVSFYKIPLILKQIITWQTSVNLVDMFKSKINFESN